MTLPAWAKPYKFKKAAAPKPGPMNRIPQRAEQEGLTGFVHGKGASDLEERLARALDARTLDYAFQYIVDTATSLPGEANNVDFVVFAGQGQPIEVDGNFTHKSAEQRGEDRIRDALIDEALQPRGFLPIMRVKEEDVSSIDAAVQTVEELFP